MSPLGIVALVFLGLAGALLAASIVLRRSATMFGTLLGAGVGCLLLAGFMVVTTGSFAMPRTIAEPSNPYPATTQSLTQGRTIYMAHCQSCHGATGVGNGPAAAGLEAPGLDLRAQVAARSDARLYRMISQGIRGTGMPAFIGRLTEDERWHVINYIRTFDDPRGAGRDATETPR